MSGEALELERPVHGLPTGWTQMTLGDALAKSEGGGTPSRDVEEYWNGDIPWASVKDIVKGEGFSPEETIKRAIRAVRMAGETVARVAFGGDRYFELIIQEPSSAADRPEGMAFDEWADRL